MIKKHGRKRRKGELDNEVKSIKKHKDKPLKSITWDHDYTIPMPPVKPPKKEAVKVTEKDIELIEGFINKKEPKRLEFNEAQAAFKMLYEIYRRC